MFISTLDSLFGITKNIDYWFAITDLSHWLASAELDEASVGLSLFSIKVIMNLSYGYQEPWRVRLILRKYVRPVAVIESEVSVAHISWTTSRLEPEKSFTVNVERFSATFDNKELINQSTNNLM